MKTKIQNLLLTLALPVLLSTLNSQLSTCFAQSTAFTYQGRVTDSGTNFTGAGQFQFALVTGTNANHAATATAEAPGGGFVTVIDVVSGGNGYTTAPTVTISGGGGSGATATATVNGGAVTKVTVNQPGGGYTSAPVVTIAPPPAAILYTTYWSNDGTSSAGSEPAAAVNVAVNNGLFTVTLGDTNTANMAAIDSSLFTQPGLQLRIWFNDGKNGFAALDPAQDLMPTPYATTASFAGSASNVLGVIPAAQIGGTIPAAQISGALSPSQIPGLDAGKITGGIFSAAQIPNLDASIIVSGTFSVARLSGTIASANLPNGLGGSGNTASGANATIGGGIDNTASGFEATISGGASNTNNGNAGFIGGGQNNTVSDNYQPTVGGGYGNTATGNYATVGGGYGNTASGDYATISGGGYNTNQSSLSFIAGGFQNQIQNGNAANIGGGYQNLIQANAYEGTIAGGGINVIGTNAYQATIGGGLSNQATNAYATVPGGENNIAGGQFSFAAGQRAKAIHNGAFVWADSQPADFASTTTNQFNVRANGGARFETSGKGMTIDGQPVLTSGSSDSGISIQQNADDTPNVILGASINYVSNSVVGATIGGGGVVNYDGAPYNYSNSVTANFGTVSGGYDNTSGHDATVGGGAGNIASGDTATVSGGGGNIASGAAATVGGGSSNQATNAYATVPGGLGNLAGGQYSFAAGQRAKAIHNGAFVWADSQPADFASMANDSFNVRAQGGTVFNTSEMAINTGAAGAVIVRNENNLVPALVVTNNNAYSGYLRFRNHLEIQPNDAGTASGYLDVRNMSGNATITLNGQSGAVTATAFNLTSDRNAKENFAAVNPQTVLEKVAALPVSEWNYKTDAAGQKHLGPMAQDFHAAFGLDGADDKHISVIDEGGVALAAIQGLNQKLEQKETEITELQARLDKLERLMNAGGAK
jgi:hypothetical protein